MRKISKAVKEKVLERPNICQRHNHKCAGRITWEHALTYAGRQIDEAWAIVKLCEFHHAVNTYQDSGDLNKQENQRIALNQATDEELMKYPKADFIQLRDRLNANYS